MSQARPRPVAFSGAVLTGGAGRRFGSDKALALLAGRPLAAYAHDALAEAGAGEILAVGGDAAALGELGFKPVTDPGQGAGPLSGIVAALGAAANELVAVLACDVPLVTSAVVTRLLDAVSDDAGAVAVVGGRLEPLLGVYRRSLGPILHAALASDAAVQRAIAGLGLVEVELEDATVAFNVNTPAQLREAEQRLRLRLRPGLRPRSTWPAGGGR